MPKRTRNIAISTIFTILIIASAFVLYACTPAMVFPLPPPARSVPIVSTSPAPAHTQQPAALVLTLTNTSLPTLTPTREWTVSPTITLTRTPIEVFETQEPGEVIAPVLLYHHVKDFKGTGDRYYVSVADFRAQMQALSDWGYQSITISELSNLILKGGVRRSRPVAITFDDGNLDVYQNAFPILKEFGFKATLYVIGDSVKHNSNMTNEMIKEVAGAGWEIGSHSMTHKDLRSSKTLQDEICTSRDFIAQKLDLPIRSFSYPFGLVDKEILAMAHDCGYTSAVGLGILDKNNKKTLYYLYRREVMGGQSIDDFAALLPWSTTP